MEYLIENAVNSDSNKELKEFQKNVVKNRTQMHRLMTFCWDYDGTWDNDIMTWSYTHFKNSITKGKKIIQKCKNKRCVNPDHLLEVDHETWYKNTLDKEQMWMDYV